MIDCLEDLLLKGIGLIDIFENDHLVGELKNSAKSSSNPHYKFGFVEVVFVVYINFEVAHHLLNRTDDETDALLVILELYQAFRLDSSQPRPLPSIDEEGRVEDGNLYLFSCGVFHPLVVHHLANLSWKSAKYLAAIPSFAARALSDIKIGSIGFDHAVWINASSGDHFIEPFRTNGLNKVFSYSNNNLQEPENRRHIYVVLRNSAISQKLDLQGRYPIQDGIKGHSYIFLFLEEGIKRRANLSRDQQRVCYLLLVGFDYKRIAQFLFKGEYDDVKRSIHDPKNQKQAYLDLQWRVRDLQHQASEKLANAGIHRKPFGVPSLIRRLEGTPQAALEIREYFFSVYPWPEDLPSRR